MIPQSYQGHVTPFTNYLAMKLASKGFTITFVNTQVIHHQIAGSNQSNGATQEHCDIFAGAHEVELDIRYKTMSDGFPLGFARMLNSEQFMGGKLRVLPAHVDELVGSLVKEDPSVTCLIGGNREDVIDYMPGVMAIEPKDLTSFLQSTDTTTIAHQIIYKAFGDVKNADFILCNAVQELESDTIFSLQEKQPFYAIGPIFPSELTKSIVPTSLRIKFDCSQWLDTKPNGSVLYVSFGSFIPSRRSDIEEIAHGLVLSKVNFIWVLRPGTVSYEESYVLPAGFEDGVKDKGLVVSWTNQTKVLLHPAIGGFLTHRGWNSVLESVWCNAVPLLCFPFLGDQPTNRKLVVDDWGIGINLCDKKPLTRTEVAKKIGHLMNGKSADILRERTAKVRQTFENALAMDGSSEKTLCLFISDVQAKIRKGQERV